MLLNNQVITAEVKEEIFLNIWRKRKQENKSKIYGVQQKAVLREEFTATSADARREEKSQVT